MNPETITPVQIPDTVPTEIVREHTIAEILADAEKAPSYYVKNFDAGRGAE
jgi:hypothetical protein